MTQDEQWAEAMKGVYEWQQEIEQHCISVLNSLGINDLQDFHDMCYDSRITGKVWIADKPEGSRNDEDFGVFKDIHVEQMSVGDSGDSYAGTIYGQLPDGKWLAVPYEC